jgi:alpha-L-rhamnosidase
VTPTKLAIVLAVAALVASWAGAAPPPTDPTLAEFRNPPPAARPYTWWHWMDGNVDRAGILADLQWMHAAGFGGFQLFHAGLSTPTFVAHRIVFQTPEWREALTAAAKEADRLGLEMGITTSAGWSATGGPWVRPEDSMRKLV